MTLGVILAACGGSDPVTLTLRASSNTATEATVQFTTPDGVDEVVAELPWELTTEVSGSFAVQVKIINPDDTGKVSCEIAGLPFPTGTDGEASALCQARGTAGDRMDVETTAKGEPFETDATGDDASGDVSDEAPDSDDQAATDDETTDDEAMDDPAPAVGGPGSPFQDQLAVGDCFDDVLVDNGDLDLSGDPLFVPCEEPHDNEVYAVETLPDDADPATLADVVGPRCDALAFEFLGERWVTATWAVFPDADEFADGHRNFACIVFANGLIGTAFSSSLGAPGHVVAAVTEIDGKTVFALYDGITGQRREIISDPELFAQRSPASWSADGTEVYFTQGVDDVDREIVRFDASGATVVLDGLREIGSASVAPDGTLAFISSEAGEFDIYVATPGSEPTRLTENPDRDTSPRWSPDGNRIAFRARVDGNSDVWVMNADGSDLTRLTDDPAFDGDPSWSPDGSQLVFTSQRSGNYDVWIMNADGSDQQNLTDHPADDEYPSWYGDLIAFQSNRHSGPTIWLMTPDGRNPSRLTTEAPVGHPALMIDALGAPS